MAVRFFLSLLLLNINLNVINVAAAASRAVSVAAQASRSSASINVDYDAPEDDDNNNKLKMLLESAMEKARELPTPFDKEPIAPAKLIHFSNAEGYRFVSHNEAQFIETSRGLKNDPYIESYIMYMPAYLGLPKDTCDFTLILESLRLKQSPVLSLLMIELLTMWAATIQNRFSTGDGLLDVYSSPDGALNLTVEADDFLPAVTITTVGTCRDVIPALLEYVRMTKMIQAQYMKKTDRPKVATERLIMIAARKVLHRLEAEAKSMRRKLNNGFNSISRSPFFSVNDYQKLAEFTRNIKWMGELGRTTQDLAAEALSSLHVTFLGFSNSNPDQGSTVAAMEPFVANLTMVASFASEPVVSIVKNFKKVEWQRSPNFVVYQTHLNTTSLQDPASLTIEAYQIFQDGIIGIQTPNCSIPLGLQAISIISNLLAEDMIAGTDLTELPRDFMILYDHLRDVTFKLGVSNIVSKVLDSHQESQYYVTEFQSVSKFGSSLTPFISAFNVLVETYLKCVQKSVLMHHMLEAAYSSSLFVRGPGTPFHAIKDFYMKELRSKAYNFNRPKQCLPYLVNLKREDLIKIWQQYLAKDGQDTRRALIHVDNSSAPLYSSVKTPTEALDGRTLLTNETEVYDYVGRQELLPPIGAFSILKRFFDGGSNVMQQIRQHEIELPSPEDDGNKV